jgi:hypothetical protein
MFISQEKIRSQLSTIVHASTPFPVGHVKPYDYWLMLTSIGYGYQTWFESIFRCADGEVSSPHALLGMQYAFPIGDRKAFLLRPDDEFDFLVLGYGDVLFNPDVNGFHTANDVDIGVLV